MRTGKTAHRLVVSPSEVLMEVVPGRDRLIVEGKLAPDNIDRLSIGHPTGVKFLAFNQRTTPELEERYTSALGAVKDGNIDRIAS